VRAILAEALERIDAADHSTRITMDGELFADLPTGFRWS
jgi:hypothetical protein